MHRSGTSALTRVLALCGAALPEQLIPAAPGNNDTGFWEPQALVDLHDAVLKSMGSSWSDLRTLPHAWFASAEAVAFRRDLGALLTAEYGAAPVVVIKDPRLCRLMPLWLPVLAAQNIAPGVVIPLRHPLEVAASLNRREAFDPARSAQLWLSHVLAAERDTRGVPRCFITYDQILTDWRTVTARIGATLAIDWTIDTECQGAVDQFLSDRWRHHTVPNAELDALPAWVAETYRWMLAAASDAEPAPDRLDRIDAAIRAAEAMLGPAIGALEAEIDRKSAEAKHWIAAAVERYAIIETQRAEIEQLTAGNQALEINPMRRALVPLQGLVHRVRGR